MGSIARIRFMSFMPGGEFVFRRHLNFLRMVERTELTVNSSTDTPQGNWRQTVGSE
jgi:hypothetical protein